MERQVALPRSAGSETLPARRPGPGKRRQARVSRAARAPTASAARFKALSKVHSIISISPTPTPTRGSPGLPEGPAPTALLMFTVAENSGHTWHGPPAHPETQPGHGNTTLNRCPHPRPKGPMSPCHSQAGTRMPQTAGVKSCTPGSSPGPFGTGRSSETGNGDPAAQHTVEHGKSCK